MGNNMVSMKDAIAVPGATAAFGPLAGAGAALGSVLGKPGAKSHLAIKANKWRGDGPRSAYQNNTIHGEVLRQIAIQQARQEEDEAP